MHPGCMHSCPQLKLQPLAKARRSDHPACLPNLQSPPAVPSRLPIPLHPAPAPPAATEQDIQVIPGTSNPRLCLLSDEYSPSLAVVNCDVQHANCGEVRGHGLPALPARLPALPACLLACQAQDCSERVPARLSACPCACLPACLPALVPACIPAVSRCLLTNAHALKPCMAPHA